jgi:hypothetical protein
MVIQLMETLSDMKSDVSPSSSQEIATGPPSEPDQFTSLVRNVFFKTHFNITYPFTLISHVVSYLEASNKMLTNIFSTHTCYMNYSAQTSTLDFHKNTRPRL